MKRTKKRSRVPVTKGALLLLVFCVLLLAGCTALGTEESAGEAGDSGRLQVVATIFPQYDFARQIAGGEADVHMLLKPGEEVHSYEPTPQDIRLIQNSDLFLYTGGENDVWVENILDSVGRDVRPAEGPRTVRLLDLVETYGEEQLEGMMPEKGGRSHGREEGSGEESPACGEDSDGQDHDLEEEHDHDHGEEPDEHVWTSPENCAVIIEKLTEEFCALDPAHADTYRKNGDAYRGEFETLDAEYREMISASVRKTIVFGDRFPFRYLAEEFGLTCYAAFSGCSAESEPSAATVAFLIDRTVEEGVPVVFRIEFSNGNIARAIAEAAQAKQQKNLKQGLLPPAGIPSGAAARPGNAKDGGYTQKIEESPQVRVLLLHSCHNVTRDEFAAGESCLSLMRQNLQALRTALY